MGFGAARWGLCLGRLGVHALSSTAANQFRARASGGFQLFADPNALVGVQLAPGANAWSIASARELKENFKPVDSRSVLEKVVALPVTEWNLKSQPAEIRHLGPVAQDFMAAFGLGEDERHISTSDAEGVALAAIKGLNQKLEERLATQAAELREKDEQIRALAERLAALEQQFARGSAN